MGTLAGFRSYLVERRKVLAACEQRLCTVQEKYEQFWGEISRVRETELEQLTAHTLADRARLPAEFNRALDEAHAKATRELEARVADLQKRHGNLAREAEELRKTSLEAEKAIKKKNAVLDGEEESLKEKSAALLTEISEHNRLIGELGKGIGFFKNLFEMRRLKKDRDVLDERQKDLAARIDRLRARWAEAEEKYESDERERKNKWIELQTESAAIQAKLEHLASTRTRVIQRSAMEQVLFARRPELVPPKQSDPACPRCAQRNPESNHFCHICALRLKQDRPDFEGSLLEIAELNAHYETFSEGMRACQQIIGLVRGMMSGVDNFTKSVDDMIQTENIHPVSKLEIDVPKKSIEFGENFERLSKAAVPEQSLHPKAFAKQISAVSEHILTEANIKGFFETMGKELSKQAGRQW